jgi:hypothetical protein
MRGGCGGGGFGVSSNEYSCPQEPKLWRSKSIFNSRLDEEQEYVRKHLNCCFWNMLPVHLLLANKGKASTCKTIKVWRRRWLLLLCQLIELVGVEVGRLFEGGSMEH